MAAALRTRRSLWQRLLALGLLSVCALAALATDDAMVCYDSEACRAAFQQTQPRCRGRYCGRVPSDDFTAVDLNASCRACPLGSRTDGWVCVSCDAPLDVYDAMYLASWVIFVGLSHCLALLPSELTARQALLLYGAAVLETFLASIFSLLAAKPYATLSPHACPVYEVADWYPIFWNPPTYGEQVYCNAEVVYPRWSIVLLFLLFSAGLVLVVRLPISTLLADRKGTPSIFGALYYLPLYAIANAVGAGLFYYAFPYILMTFVLLFNVFHLSRKSQGVFRFPRNLALFAARYALLSFCVAAIMLQFPTARANITPLAIGLTAVLSPAVPSLVYFLTTRCTDPEYW